MHPLAGVPKRCLKDDVETTVTLGVSRSSRGHNAHDITG